MLWIVLIALPLARIVPTSAEPRVRVLHAASSAAVVDAVLAKLPAEHVALIDEIDFIEPILPRHQGACGEAVVRARRILIISTPVCLAVLPHVLAHEVGHHVDYVAGWRLSWRPGCREDASGAYPGFCQVEAEAWAEDYARRYGF